MRAAFGIVLNVFVITVHGKALPPARALQTARRKVKKKAGKHVVKALARRGSVFFTLATKVPIKPESHYERAKRWIVQNQLLGKTESETRSSIRSLKARRASARIRTK